MESEKSIETRLREGIRKLGGIAYKFVSPGNNGVPDRLVCLPQGQVCFVELKAPKKHPTPQQINQMGKLRQLGFAVRVLDSKQAVDIFLQEVQHGI